MAAEWCVRDVLVAHSLDEVSSELIIGAIPLGLPQAAPEDNSKPDRSGVNEGHLHRGTQVREPRAPEPRHGSQHRRSKFPSYSFRRSPQRGLTTCFHPMPASRRVVDRLILGPAPAIRPQVTVGRVRGSVFGGGTALARRELRRARAEIVAWKERAERSEHLGTRLKSQVELGKEALKDARVEVEETLHALVLAEEKIEEMEMSMATLRSDHSREITESKGRAERSARVGKRLKTQISREKDALKDARAEVEETRVQLVLAEERLDCMEASMLTLRRDYNRYHGWWLTENHSLKAVLQEVPKRKWDAGLQAIASSSNRRYLSYTGEGSN